MTSDPASPQQAATVVVFATRYPPAFRGGGPIRTLEALVLTSPPGYDVRVVTRDTDQGDHAQLAVDVDTWSQRDGISVRYASVEKLRSLMSAMASARAHRPELVYVNSFFDFHLSIVPQLLRKIGYLRSKRLLVAPRGEFGIAAIASKSRKKQLFLTLYRRLGLHRGVLWHASSPAEKADIERVWGSAAQVLVRENDTLLPVVSDRAGLHDNDELSPGPLSLISVGRIVEHKGLHLVMDALSEAPGAVDLDVFGPAEDSAYLERCLRMVGKLPKQVSVRFHDSLPHEDVRSTMSGFDALVMPTAGENFGHVIAEALSVGCPIICSDTTPWSRTLAEGGGVVVPERTTESWRRALDEYVMADPEERRRRRGLAADAYDRWKAQQAKPHVFDLVLAAPLIRS
ncbi:glycosyltransferase involved in cell wall biosynthesis [Frigoribacterium sp. PvP054]|uniref:glycosyltransferase family 4 protein n=1 Tax=Frigoribacterium sp. PvP054 TaxID=3156438 RepID=UPI003397052F